jgi:hypothetical protein
VYFFADKIREYPWLGFESAPKISIIALCPVTKSGTDFCRHRRVRATEQLASGAVKQHGAGYLARKKNTP